MAELRAMCKLCGNDWEAVDMDTYCPGCGQRTTETPLQRVQELERERDELREKLKAKSVCDKCGGMMFTEELARDAKVWELRENLKAAEATILSGGKTIHRLCQSRSPVDPPSERTIQWLRQEASSKWCKHTMAIQEVLDYIEATQQGACEPSPVSDVAPVSDKPSQSSCTAHIATNAEPQDSLPYIVAKAYQSTKRRPEAIKMATAMSDALSAMDVSTMWSAIDAYVDLFVETSDKPAEPEQDGESIAAEQARWQDAIYVRLNNAIPDSVLLDGAGCDSGDPLDVTLSEISQALSYYQDELRERTLQHKTQLDNAVRLELEKTATAEPEQDGGCVYDGDFIKVFKGPKGEAWAYTDIEGCSWYRQASGCGRRPASTLADCESGARELAGIKPEDDVPEAFRAEMERRGIVDPAIQLEWWRQTRQDSFAAGWRAASGGGETDA